MSPRIYTYKVTFEEVPYYYYGVHKEKSYDEEYFGSPITHKWAWEYYTPKKQILEIFDYSDEGWIKAQEIEKQLIKPFYNTDKWCLNENCGGLISLQINRDTAKKVGIANKLLGRGIFSMSESEKFSQRSKAGKISGNLTKQRGTGIFGMSYEDKILHNKKAGKLGGEKVKELGVAIFGMSQEKILERNQKGAKIINSIKWKCTITGYVSTSGPLTLYQRHRGIDIINRIRVN